MKRFYHFLNRVSWPFFQLGQLLFQRIIIKENKISAQFQPWNSSGIAWHMSEQSEKALIGACCRPWNAPIRDVLSRASLFSIFFFYFTREKISRLPHRPQLSSGSDFLNGRQMRWNQLPNRRHLLSNSWTWIIRSLWCQWRLFELFQTIGQHWKY